jgi:cyclopropane-fatty-acyl-phospholipid synthase
MAVLDIVTAPVSAVLNTITSQAWQPLVSMCRTGTLAQLQNIKIGRLVLFESGESKASTVFGVDKEGVPVAFLDVHDEKFWVRLALFADMVCLPILTSCILDDSGGSTRG